MKKLSLESLLAAIMFAALIAAGSPSSGATEVSAGCTGSERDAWLLQGQEAVLSILKRDPATPDDDLTTLRGPEDLARLAAPDPGSGTAYNVLPHMFASMAGVGLGIFNSGYGSDFDPAIPDMLLYAPNPAAADATDPYGPDFPYTLAGWGYFRTPYNYTQHPTFLGDCIVRGDWTVHERGIHRADTWGMLAVPPAEDVKGTAAGQEPILPADCDDAATADLETCPQGSQHGRGWDIHFFLTDDGPPSVSIRDPDTSISGFGIEVGRDFFYPDGSILELLNCDALFPFINRPIETVNSLLPNGFRAAPDLLTDPTGKTGLASIETTSCESMRANGSEVRDSSLAIVLVTIEDPLCPTPQSLAESLACEDRYYLPYFATDSKVIRDWFRGQAPSYPIWWVPDLVHETIGVDDALGGLRRAVVPNPAPSRFKLDAEVIGPTVPVTLSAGKSWANLGGCKVAVYEFATDLLGLGYAQGTVTEATGEVAQLLGSETESFGGYTGAGAHLTKDREILRAPRVIADARFCEE